LFLHFHTVVFYTFLSSGYYTLQIKVVPPAARRALELGFLGVAVRTGHCHARLLILVSIKSHMQLHISD